MVKSLYLMGESCKKVKKILSSFEKEQITYIPLEAIEAQLITISSIDGHEKGSREKRIFSKEDIIKAAKLIKHIYKNKN